MSCVLILAAFQTQRKRDGPEGNWGNDVATSLFVALLAEQTVLSAVVEQVVVTLLTHLNAMDCPAHTIPALA